jgi:hypothetical protein
MAMPKTKLAKAVENDGLDKEPAVEPTKPEPKPKEPECVEFYSPHKNCRVRIKGRDGLIKIDPGGTKIYDKSIIEGLRKDKYFGMEFFEKKG